MFVHSLLSSIVLLSGLLTTALCQRQDAFQETLGHIRSQTPPEIQAAAAQGVAERLLGIERAKHFVLLVNPDYGPIGKDTFLIKKNHFGQVEILGSSGVAAAWGLHYYLKNYRNDHISWEGNQIGPYSDLPDVYEQITSNDRFRYYQNVCSFGYTSAWWQWDQWERHIDWMALNGINLALAFNGQEAIWQRVYHQLNFTTEEINEHFGGPAFLPWSRMGNIRGFGGPLSSNWHEKSLQLQHRILRRMRELGIIPVLPAFAGYVPRAFPSLFPKVNVTKNAVWNQFSDKYCCPYLLDPAEPLFQKIGELFLQTYIEEFGTDHVYNCDTFNENEPHTGQLKFLRNVGHSIYTAMNNVDRKAIWLMQGWLFVHDLLFWTEPRVEAFLTSVPLGKIIVLDLQSEQFPQYKRLNSYYGQPYIWCMLHNFGGTLGMFGSAPIISSQVMEARNTKGSTMVGTGLTPEGINQNYVIYDLMNEMAYQQESVYLDDWFESYASRRYGEWNEYTVAAWKNLRRTVYSYADSRKIRGKYVITRRPSLSLTPWTWYDREQFFHTWYVFLQPAHDMQDNTLYRHDVVDITRQALQLKADELYIDLMDAFNKKNIIEFKSQAARLLELFDDLEAILASSKDFLLGRWLEMAKQLASTEAEMKLYEYNARNQITLWGPRGEIRDYGNKQWSGVVADYFKPRWTIFLDGLTTTLTNGTKLDINKINRSIFLKVEKPFTFSRKIYPTVETGDCIDIALKIQSKWYQPPSTLSTMTEKLHKRKDKLNILFVNKLNTSHISFKDYYTL